MKGFGVFLVLLVSAILYAECAISKTGVQMRLTEKGIQYAIDVGKNIIRKELIKRSLDASGKTGKISYRLSRMRLTDVSFDDPKITPISNVGLHAEFAGISLKGSGNVWYKYSGWIKYSDDIDMSVSVSNVHISTTLRIIATPDGHPDLAIKSCQANVRSIDLKFHGGKAWIYNVFSGIIEKKLESKFNSMLCKVLTKAVAEKARPELETFPVMQRLDKWAELDYRLTQSPVFTKSYMDAFFKGEFRSATTHQETILLAPTFTTNPDHKKMLYFWVTDYAFNTAGEVYQGSNQFDIELKSWDKKVPGELQKILNTDKFKIVIPNLSRYPNRPMSVRLVSYKASKVVINEGNLHLFLFANASFSIKLQNGTVSEAFKLRFDIVTTASVHVQNNRIGGKITEFHYETKVLQSNIGKIPNTLDYGFFKIIVETAIISRANPILQKGFPLPQIERVEFKDTEVIMHKNVIRIGTDFKYTPPTNTWNFQ